MSTASAQHPPQPPEGLDLENLTITYDTDSGPMDIVRDVSFRIEPGEIFGLVGESGSGKTTIARGIVGYLAENGRVSEGSIKLDGTDLLSLSKQEMRRVWGSAITMVHQDPNRSVNPSMPIGNQIAETAQTHLGMSKAESMQKAIEMLDMVKMPDPRTAAKRYAHQLSGGQLQRVLIAIALTTNPRLLILDEPTTALDVTTEAVILDLVRDLLSDYQTAVLYITHNLAVVARVCDRVGVIYAGEMFEVGPVRRVFTEMLHPYTLGLLGSVPRIDVNKDDIVLRTIPGYIPQPDNLPDGCIFAPRCLGAEDACRKARPPLAMVDKQNDHATACRRWQALREDPDKFARKEGKHPYRDPTTEEVVLETVDLEKHFPVGRIRIRDLIAGTRPHVHAVDGISIRVRKSFTMGIVGESGCGKTTFARCVAGLEKATSGTIVAGGEELGPTIGKRTGDQLKNIQMVFQNPDASLNPQNTVGMSVARPLQMEGKLNKAEIRQRVEQLFEAVNLPSEYMSRLPHEISGGEKQRVAVARAFATNPELLICDEPISSLDVSVQASLMNMLIELQQTKNVSYLFISHDLAAVRHLSDWIAVIYLGWLCEIGSAVEVFTPPHHPYTEALLSALPIPDPEIKRDRIRLHGDVPSSVDIPPGCRFHPRCPRKIGTICETDEPAWVDAGHWHQIRCHIPTDELLRIQDKDSG